MTDTNIKVTQKRIIEFQDAIIELLENTNGYDLKTKMFLDAYKSQVEDLKQQLKDAE